MGLERDGPEIYQSTRAARHAEVAHAMLETGHAYRCWSTPEEIAAAREQGPSRGPPAALRQPLAGPHGWDRPLT